jgi:uncharacterized membrane protein (UPF0182 family)
MYQNNYSNTFKPFAALMILSMLHVGSLNAQLVDTQAAKDNQANQALQYPIYWNIKAYRPDAKLIAIKAIDNDGKIHDVKAIQDSDDTSVLSVKALVHGALLPIKLIVKEDEAFYPVKAIDADGYLIAIKAITEDGDIWDVKGVSMSGNVVHIRAINKHLTFYNIIAISPEGKVNTVKGIKMLDTRVETIINGIPVFAHVKSLAQN